MQFRRNLRLWFALSTQVDPRITDDPGMLALQAMSQMNINVGASKTEALDLARHEAFQEAGSDTTPRMSQNMDHQVSQHKEEALPYNDEGLSIVSAIEGTSYNRFGAHHVGLVSELIYCK